MPSAGDNIPTAGREAVSSDTNIVIGSHKPIAVKRQRPKASLGAPTGRTRSERRESHDDASPVGAGLSFQEILAQKSLGNRPSPTYSSGGLA